MKVCLISVEIFAWGKYGGFGRATRTIGRSLAQRGHDIYAVIPRRADQKPVEKLDGITVLGFEPTNIFQQIRFLRQVDADIYHSQEPSMGTFLSLKSMPNKKHVITLRDPRSWEDWQIEYRLPSSSRFQVMKNWIYEDNPLVHHAVRESNAIFAASHTIAARGKKKYNLKTLPEFLPTPVIIPKEVKKASRPTVCYIARFDRRKRPELFFELAKHFPDVRFIAMGESRDRGWDRDLRNTYSHIPNLNIFSFVNQFHDDLHRSTLEESWIMVNTSAREGLPNSLIEAAANGCAILSAVNPDQFTKKFGYHAVQDDFTEGLRWLLEKNRWQILGEKARRFTRETFDVECAIQHHLQVYEKILDD